MFLRPFWPPQENRIRESDRGSILSLSDFADAECGNIYKIYMQ